MLKLIIKVLILINLIDLFQLSQSSFAYHDYQAQHHHHLNNQYHKKAQQTKGNSQQQLVKENNELSNKQEKEFLKKTNLENLIDNVDMNQIISIDNPLESTKIYPFSKKFKLDLDHNTKNLDNNTPETTLATTTTTTTSLSNNNASKEVESYPKSLAFYIKGKIKFEILQPQMHMKIMGKWKQCTLVDSIRNGIEQTKLADNNNNNFGYPNCLAVVPRNVELNQRRQENQHNQLDLKPATTVSSIIKRSLTEYGYL